ncbi:MAG TPA: hypothetical protein VFW96_25640 [Thermomicrobiales bacterium]|nr:hypothetical protein [Thermomicrobiales bacterium]
MSDEGAGRVEVRPAAGEDEAAALMAALEAYLAARRQEAAAPASWRPWALAGRLEGQGQGYARVRGLRPRWGNAARLASR